MHVTFADDAVRQPDGTPIVFRVLSAYFQLESFRIEDAAALAQANAIILDWFGSELRWTWHSDGDLIEPFEPGQLSMAELVPEDLDVSDLEGPFFESEIDARSITREALALFCHGAQVRNFASPYSYRFVYQIDSESKAARIDTHGYLRITVPFSYPLDVFQSRVRAIAACLRLRWGAAGYGLNGWEFGWREILASQIYAMCRRSPGYDVGPTVGTLRVWHDIPRTVNWLTWLGPAMAAALEKRRGQALQSRGRIAVAQDGENMLLQAGAHPATGDTNRLDYPEAYRQADAIIRPLRWRSQWLDRLDFGSPWDINSSTQWLERFTMH